MPSLIPYRLLPGNLGYRIATRCRHDADRKTAHSGALTGRLKPIDAQRMNGEVLTKTGVDK